MARRVPNYLIEQVLGKEKTVDGSTPTKKKKDGSDAKKRGIQKKSIVTRGRKDVGMKNPRGGRYSSQDVRQQLSGRPGDHPQDAKSSLVDDLFNEGIVKAEKKKSFDRNDPKVTSRLFKETISAIGSKKFYENPNYGSAAEQLGLEEEKKLSPKQEANYGAMTPKMRRQFWEDMLDGADAGQAMANAMKSTAVTEDVMANDDAPEADSDEDEEGE